MYTKFAIYTQEIYHQLCGIFFFHMKKAEKIIIHIMGRDAFFLDYSIEYNYDGTHFTAWN